MSAETDLPDKPQDGQTLSDLIFSETLSVQQLIPIPRVIHYDLQQQQYKLRTIVQSQQVDNMNENTEGLTIGKLAQAADINIETIRYYQRIGLIEEPKKPASGFRRYPPQLLQRLRFIKRAQRLGFTLNEIAELLELGSGCCEDIRQKAEQKQALVMQQINDLTALNNTLSQLITSCKHGDNPSSCPIVESLSKTEGP